MVLISRDSIVDWSKDDERDQQALCVKFPVPHTGADPWFDRPHEAIAVCNGTSGGPVCPMRTRCLKRALVNNESWGVWGGMYPHDRKALKRAHPEDPEAWQWHPPTEPTRRKRRKNRRARRHAASKVSWTTARPPASCWPTYAPTSPPRQLYPIQAVAPMYYTPARSASRTGAPGLPLANYAI